MRNPYDSYSLQYFHLSDLKKSCFWNLFRLIIYDFLSQNRIQIPIVLHFRQFHNSHHKNCTKNPLISSTEDTDCHFSPFLDTFFKILHTHWYLSKWFCSSAKKGIKMSTVLAPGKKLCWGLTFEFEREVLHFDMILFGVSRPGYIL